MSGHGSGSLSSSMLLRMSTDVVVAYVKHNPLPTSDLTNVIAVVHKSLSELDGNPNQPAHEPAVPIGRSIKPDYIVCLEDGKKLKMLKRHLRTAYGMSPEEYRKKWGLRADYPMVAPNYAKQRSAFAKQIGLGKSARTPG